VRHNLKTHAAERGERGAERGDLREKLVCKIYMVVVFDKTTALSDCGIGIKHVNTYNINKLSEEKIRNKETRRHDNKISKL
jgi:hypothetical protein